MVSFPDRLRGSPPGLPSDRLHEIIKEAAQVRSSYPAPHSRELWWDQRRGPTLDNSPQTIDNACGGFAGVARIAFSTWPEGNVRCPSRHARVPCQHRADSLEIVRGLCQQVPLGRIEAGCLLLQERGHACEQRGAFQVADVA